MVFHLAGLGLSIAGRPPLSGRRIRVEADHDMCVEEGARHRLLGTCASGGRTPREFAIGASGQVMIVANRDNHDLRMLRIDSDAGQLAAIGEGYKTGSPVCVIAADRQYRGRKPPVALVCAMPGLATSACRRGDMTVSFRTA